MNKNKQKLPLFPLKTVLFPGGSLPLNVFEDRYKVLMRECLDTDSRFGIVLIKEGPEVGEGASTYKTGTVALAKEVKYLPDGRILLNAHGEYRFKIIEIMQTTPYIEAVVEIDDERDQGDIPNLEIQDFSNAAKEHIKSLLGLKGGWIQDTVIPKSPFNLSYFLAHLVDATMPQKQELLEKPSCHQRLQDCVKAIRKEKLDLIYQTRLQLLKNFSKN